MQKSLWMILACICSLGTGVAVWLADVPHSAVAKSAMPPSQSATSEKANKTNGPRLDAFGDSLPAGALFRLGTVQLRHPQLKSLVFTKDGRFLISEGGDRVVRVWSFRNGRPAMASRDFADVDAFTLNGKDQLIIAEYDQGKRTHPTITVWDVATNRQITSFEPKISRVQAICGSSDGKVAYAVANEFIQALDLEKGKVLFSTPIASVGSDWENDKLKNRNGGEAELRLYINHGGYRIALAPNGRYVAAISDFSNKFIYKFNTSDKTPSLLDAAGIFEREDIVPLITPLLGFSSDSTRLVISDCDEKHWKRIDGTYRVAVIDYKTGKKYFCIDGRSSGCFAFSTDGKELATAASQKMSKVEGSDLVPLIQIWDAATGKEKRTLSGTGRDPVRVLAYSFDGKWLASGGDDGVIQLWDLSTGRESSPAVPSAEPVASLTSSPDGRQLLTVGSPGHLHWWDATTGRLTRTLRHAPLKGAALDFSSDGKRLVVAGLKPGAPPTRSAYLYLLEGEARYEAIVLEVGGKEVCRVRDIDSPCVKLCGNGRHLLYIKGKVLCRLDLDTGKEVGKFESTHVNCVKWFTLSPDESLIATEDKDNFLGIWDAKKRLLLHSESLVEWLPAPPNPRMANNGSLICLSIDVALRTIGYLNYDRPGSSCNEWDHSLVFAPDNRTLAFRVMNYKKESEFIGIDGQEDLQLEKKELKLLSKVYLLDLKNFRNCQLDGDFHYFASLAFSPDGQTLAGASPDDYSIQLFEKATLKKRASFHGHKGSIWGLQFSPDGRQLYSLSEDTTTLAWDLASHALASTSPALSAGLLQARWTDLKSEDVAKAYQAISALAVSPEQVLPLLYQSLVPVTFVPDSERVKQLIAELDSDDFHKRTRASTELKKLGELVEPALEKAEKENSSSLEFKHLVTELLDAARVSAISPLRGEELRQMRGVELLERIGNSEARSLLKKLAGGTPSARLTREAEASLRRLEARTHP